MRVCGVSFPCVLHVYVSLLLTTAQGDIVALAPAVPVPTEAELSLGWQVGEAIVMAEFDISAQRRLRKTARGAGFSLSLARARSRSRLFCAFHPPFLLIAEWSGSGMLEGSAQLEPELCRVPLASEYRQGNLDVARMWL